MQSKTLSTCSSVDIALAVAQMGAAYGDYANEIVNRNINGAKLAAMSVEEFNMSLENWGINNRLHRLVLERKLRNLKEDQQTQTLQEPSLLSNDERKRQLLADAQLEYVKEQREYEALTAYQMILQSKVTILARQCGGAARSNSFHARNI